MIDREPQKILFVCSMNQWRSPTGEAIYSTKPQITARSCGTSNKARRTARASDLIWADLIFAMEQKHLKRLLHEFPKEMACKHYFVLDIPDDYQSMSSELIEEIKSSVDPILERKQSEDVLGES